MPRKGDVNPLKRAGIHFTRAKYRGVNTLRTMRSYCVPHARTPARAMKVPTRDVWVVVDHPCIGLVRCRRSGATDEKRFIARIRRLVSAGSMTKLGFDAGHKLV